MAALLVLVCPAVIYDCVNGFQDGANIIATMIASGAMGCSSAWS